MAIVRVRRRSELAARLLGPEARNKYNAQPVVIDGHRFASTKEADRYRTLCVLQQQKIIRGLTLQPRYKFIVAGKMCGTYVADFRYWLTRDNRVVVEDVKSPATRTRLYILKRNLLEALHGIVVEEV